MSPVPQFDETFRHDVARRLAAFVRDPVCRSAHPLKRAAVAITLVRAGAGAGFLLTRRSAHLRAHGGQWALPGGRCDEGETAAQAALRELDEELGLSLGERDVLGLLDDYPTRSGYVMTPVVLWGGTSPDMAPQPGEVASIHHMTFTELQRPDSPRFVTIPESDRPVVQVPFGRWFVHAPTGAVLLQFRRVVLEGVSERVAHLEQPPFAWR